VALLMDVLRCVAVVVHIHAEFGAVGTPCAAISLVHNVLEASVGIGEAVLYLQLPLSSGRLLGMHVVTAAVLPLDKSKCVLMSSDVAAAKRLSWCCLLAGRVLNLLPSWLSCVTSLCCSAHHMIHVTFKPWHQWRRPLLLFCCLQLRFPETADELPDFQRLADVGGMAPSTIRDGFRQMLPYLSVVSWGCPAITAAAKQPKPL
jgi:hypothetical protein